MHISEKLALSFLVLTQVDILSSRICQAFNEPEAAESSIMNLLPASPCAIEDAELVITCSTIYPPNSEALH